MMKKFDTTAAMVDQVLPADECAIISLAFEYPDKVGVITAGLKEDHFKSTIVRSFYTEVSSLMKQGKPVVGDYVRARVIEANRSMDQEYLDEALDAVDYAGATMESLDLYKKVIISQWMYDSAVGIASSWVTRAKREDDPNIQDLIYKLKEDMDDVIKGDFSIGLSPLEIFNQQVVPFINEAAAKKASYILTGLKSLDELMSKPTSGELIVLQAAASHGKTSFVTSITRSALRSGRSYFYRSGEMGTLDLVRKEFQGEFSISTKYMSEGYLVGHEKSEDFIREFRELLSTDHAKNSRVDAGSLSVAECRSVCYHNFHKFGTDLFIFDRAELFKEAGTLRSNIGDQQRVIGQGLRAIANELGVTIIIVAQLTKEAATKRKASVGQYNAMGGMAWPANATMILELFNASQEGLKTFPSSSPWKEKATRLMDGILYQMVSITIKKNTYGSKGSVMLAYWPDGQVFFDLGKSKVVGSSYDPSYEEKRLTNGYDLNPGFSLEKVSMSYYASDDRPDDDEFEGKGSLDFLEGGSGNFNLGLNEDEDEDEL